ILATVVCLAVLATSRRRLQVSSSPVNSQPHNVLLSGDRSTSASFRVAKTNPPSRSNHRQLENLERLPLSFEPNQGQSDPRVKFLSRGAGYTLFLVPDGAVFKLEQHRSARKEEGVLSSGQQGFEQSTAYQDSPQSVVRMKLLGSKPTAKIVA